MLGINRKTLGRTPKRLILTVVLQNNKKSAAKQNKLNIDGYLSFRFLQLKEVPHFCVCF